MHSRVVSQRTRQRRRHISGRSYGSGIDFPLRFSGVSLVRAAVVQTASHALGAVFAFLQSLALPPLRDMNGCIPYDAHILPDAQSSLCYRHHRIHGRSFPRPPPSRTPSLCGSLAVRRRERSMQHRGRQEGRKASAPRHAGCSTRPAAADRIRNCCSTHERVDRDAFWLLFLAKLDPARV